MAANLILAQKKFGQNFLVSAYHLQLLESQVEGLLTLTQPNRIIEIGPGTGALTSIILRQTELEVEAWEIDAVAIEYIQTHLPDPRIRLVPRDALQYLAKRALKYDPAELPLGLPFSSDQVLDVGQDDNPAVMPVSRWVVISNLPYNVGSRILIELTLQPEPPLGFLVMLQKEVGAKLLQKSKSMNLFGAYLNLYWQFTWAGKFPRSAFQPQPKVESMLIRAVRVNLSARFPVTPSTALYILKNLLKHPNKTLANNLKNLNWSPLEIQNFMDQHGYQPNLRLEIDNYRQLLIQIEAQISSRQKLD